MNLNPIKWYRFRKRLEHYRGSGYVGRYYIDKREDTIYYGSRYGILVKSLENRYRGLTESDTE